MKYVCVAVAALATAFLLLGQGTSPATYVDHDKVAATFAKGGSLAKGGDFAATGNRRTGPGEVEVHDKETDLFYVIDGEATLVTGGTMTGGKQTKANQWRGTGVEGGVTHQLKKGDFIAIPAGTPHWFKEVPQFINYYTIKVVKP